jgi:hypothetical protein
MKEMRNILVWRENEYHSVALVLLTALTMMNIIFVGRKAV